MTTGDNEMAFMVEWFVGPDDDDVYVGGARTLKGAINLSKSAMPRDTHRVIITASGGETMRDWTIENGHVMTEPELAAYPRDKQELMQSDWERVTVTLRMLQDRALTGTSLHLMRPSWYPVTGDYLSTMRESVINVIKDIFSTAVAVDEPDNTDTGEY